MATHKRFNPFLKANNDTGFGTSTTTVGGRFINKDGSFNVRKEGTPFYERFSIYHSMLNMPRWKFISTILIFYFSINVVYTLLYFFLTGNEFQGMIAETSWEKFKEMFFFSTETFTTVGYGRVNPVGDTANLIAAIEAMTGFLSFAIATGLIYGRFSKPKAYLKFSHHALISPYQDKTGLMFRLVSYKQNHILTDVDVTVTMGLQVNDNGTTSFKFYSLPLERKHIDSLPMNLTVVHPIDEISPIFGFTSDDMQASDVEVYVLVRGFDDGYSNIVLQRTSYTYEEIIFDSKFVPMYHQSDDKNTTILELDKLGKYQKL